MRINQSINFNISAVCNKRESFGNKSKTSDTNSILNLNKTPDYLVKTPLRYTKLGVENLPQNLNAHVYKLENGQKVIIVLKEGPTVIKTYVNTGSLNEIDSQRGISHFVEHSLFNGSDGLLAGEVFSSVNKMGAITNASTGFSATDYYIKSNLFNKNDLNEQLKIHASMLETPKFLPEMIEKEKGPVISEISMILDDVENIAVNNSIKNLFNIKTDSIDMIGGTIDNINNLDREKVLNYYNKNYYPSNMITVITGNVNEKEVIGLVSKHMHSKDNKNHDRVFEALNPITQTVRNDIVSDKASSAFICIGFKGPENNNIKDLIVFDAINYLLADSAKSKINKSLESVQSTVNIDLERVSSGLKDNTAILITTTVGDKNSEKAINKINSVLDNFVSNTPSDKDIEILKENLKFEFERRFERSSDINSLLGGAALDGNLSYVTNYTKYVDSLTREDFVEFVEKYFDTNKESVTVIHPSNKISFAGRTPLNIDNIESKTLSNNVLLVKNNTNQDIVYIDLKIINDKEEVNYGAEAIMSKLLLRGTALKSRDVFYDEIEEKGIFLLGFNSKDNAISSTGAFSKNNTDDALKLIKEILLNPRFTEKDFIEVKKQLIQDLSKNSVNATENLNKELFSNTSKGITKKELLNKIKNVRLEDVKNYYNTLLNNAQLIVSVSGPFKDKSFDKTVEEAFEKDFSSIFKYQKKSKYSFEPVQNSKVITEIHNKSQAEIVAGYKFKINDTSTEKMIRYSLLNIILGGTASSRLFNDLREKEKLAYHVKSFMDYQDDDTGVCNLYIKTTTDDSSNYKNIKKSIEGFNKHVKKIMTEKVSESELENAKLIYKNKILNDNETTQDKNSTILNNVQTKYGLNLTNETMNVVDSITTDDIQKAAEEIFNNNVVYSIISKQEALDYNKQFLKDLTE